MIAVPSKLNLKSLLYFVDSLRKYNFLSSELASELIASLQVIDCSKRD